LTKKDINKSGFLKVDVLSVSAAHLLHDIYSSFLAPILPLLIEKLSLSYSLASLLSVVQRAPSLLNPFVGLFADKFQPKYFIILTPTITAIAMSLLGSADSYIALVILLLTAGLSATLFHVPGPVLIKRLSGDRTGKGMSFYMVGGELARTIGPIIILAAVSFWGLSGTYKLIPFAVGLSFYLYLRLRKLEIKIDKKNFGSREGAGETFKKLIPFFVVISGYSLSRAMMKGALTTFLPVFMISKGNSVWLSGIALSVLQFAGVLGTLYAGSVSDKIGRKKALLIVAVISPVLMWLFMFSTGVFSIVLLVLMGISLFASSPVLLALVQDVKSDRPAFVNSIYMTVNFGLSSLAVFLLGYLSDIFGLVLTYKFAALMSFFAIPFTFWIKDSEKHNKSQIH
jgi:FSR family fosmidomycin resistance protein-like MFS transporter